MSGGKIDTLEAIKIGVNFIKAVIEAKSDGFTMEEIVQIFTGTLSDVKEALED